MVKQLVAEWAALSTKPRVLRLVNEWGLPGGPLHQLDDVLERCGFGHEATFTDGDRCLAQVIARASHDELAARIVLQRILPPLIAIAARRGRIVKGGFNEAFSTTLGHAWLLIRTYPLDRRPARVASNLVRDTEYHAFVRPTRYRRFSVQLCDSVELAELPSETSNDGFVDALHDLLHGSIRERLSQRSLELLDELSAGATVEQIAVRHGVRVRTVRTWRRAAINELRGQMQSAA